MDAARQNGWVHGWQHTPYNVTVAALENTPIHPFLGAPQALPWERHKRLPAHGRHAVALPPAVSMVCVHTERVI